MPLTGSGQISIGDIAGEFGGSAPHALSEYYDKGNAPGSGEIQVAADFYGTSDFVSTAQIFSSSGSYTINSAETSFQYKISGGGGGGGKAGCFSGSCCGGAGGTTTIAFNTGQTITAAGGSGGGSGGNQCANSYKSFGPPAGWPSNPWTASTGGHNNNGRSDGGRGAKDATDCNAGGCGAKGSHSSGTYTKPSGATSITVTIGGGGAGGRNGEGYQSGPGQPGAVWFLGNAT